GEFSISPEKMSTRQRDNEDKEDNDRQRPTRTESPARPATVCEESSSPSPPKTEAEVFRRDLETGVTPTLPLCRYLCQAVNHFRRGEDFEEWQAESLFPFIRLAKAHPDLSGATAEQAFKKVDQQFGRWAKAARRPKGADPWEHWLDVD